MFERNLNQRLILIGVVLLLACVFLYPPQRQLRGGLDIEGGFSLILEIQEEPGEPSTPQLAEEMKRLLQRRVDPAGVMETRWSVIGNNRIEVQVPLPPKRNKELREAYLAVQKELFARNVERSALERVFATAPEARGEMARALSGGNSEREKLILAAAAEHDAFQKLRAERAASESTASAPVDDASTSQAASQSVTDWQIAERDAGERFSDAIDLVLAMNLDTQVFSDTLELTAESRQRIEMLDRFRAQHPELSADIDRVVGAYDAWKKERVYLESPADLVRLLSGAGVLEFRILSRPSAENVTLYDRYRKQLQERGPRPVAGDTEGWFRIDNPVAFMNLPSAGDLETLEPRMRQDMVVDRRGKDWFVLAGLTPEKCMLHGGATGPQWSLKKAGVGRDQLGRRSVTFELDAVGAPLFRKLTSENVNQELCVLIDDVAYSAATIQEAIGAHGQISGDFSTEKLTYLLQTMQAGALPGRLKDTPVSERIIGSSLGQTNLRKAFWSGILGTAAVMLMMAYYYGLCGWIANLGLICNIVLTLAAMAMLNARFSLAGIAGVILTVGMAVDANVLIFERMREEKERGSTLRMIVRNGYDKAFWTIFDSNLTTLLAAVILYYVGSEEIKGFGLTLGWGIATSMFSALFITKAVFALLLKYNLLRDIRMRKWIGVPNIDWYGMRKTFFVASAVVLAIGLTMLFMRGKRDTLDVEFLGGVNAEIEFKPAAAAQFDDTRIREVLTQAAESLGADGQKLRGASVTPVEGEPASFDVSAAGVSGARLAAMIAEPLEEQDSGKLLQRGGIGPVRENAVRVRVREGVSADRLTTAIQALASGDASIPMDAGELRRANIGRVIDAGAAAAGGAIWNLTTTVTNKALVQHALLSAFGDNLNILPRVLYVLRADEQGRPFPIQDRRLESVLPGAPAGTSADLTDFLGGAAMWFDQLTPPQSVAALQTRLDNMRLQPDYQDLPYRKTQVIGVTPAGTSTEGAALFSSVVIVVADPHFIYSDNPDTWASEFAQPELSLATGMLDSEQALRKVTQFKPQIADQSATRASLAMLLAWVMIIAYVWLRFGRPIYGMAGVVALVHDVLVGLALVGLSGWIGGSNHPIGAALLIDDFKIDMTIIAALLTIIGYSINDTIVIFDRIRELKGRLGVLTPEIINRALNQTLSRTLLTATTVFIVVLFMYIFGGSSIRGFNFCMIVGCLSGSYSTLAIATPLLLVTTRTRVERAAPRVAPA